MANSIFFKTVASSKNTTNIFFTIFNNAENNMFILNRSISSISDSERRVNKNSNNFISSPFKPLKEIETSLPQYLFEELDSWHNKTAIVCSVTKREYTYEEIRLKSRNLAKSLRRKLNLQEADVVAALLPNIPEFLIIILAAFQAGIVLTTLNPLYTSEEISRQLVDADVKAIFTLNSTFNIANESVRSAHKNIPIITLKTEASQSTEAGSINFTEFVDTEYEKGDLNSPSLDNIAILPYSSGTTGLPKGVLLTHKNILVNLQQFLHLEHLEKATETSQDVVPLVLPLFHIYGMIPVLLNGFRSGARMVTIPTFSPEYFTALLRDYKPSFLFTAPPLINFMISSPMVKTEHLQSLRSILSGAAPIGVLDEKKFLEKAEKKINFLQAYGLTEASPVVTSTSVKRQNEIDMTGSVGEALPDTLIKIVPPDDPSGNLVKPYEKGELLVKGPQVMKGYFNRPEQTAATIIDNGWLRTGDLAYYNENNLIFITDRLKELIKVKGFQVAPAELEELIRDHPEVQDAAVIGVPHDVYGEVPRAYVVPKKDGKIDEKKLNEYLSKKVINYKLIRGGVSLMDSIPKNLSGKILRKDLKRLYETEKK